MPRQAHTPVSGYAEARCPPARARPGRFLPEAGRPTVTGAPPAGGCTQRHRQCPFPKDWVPSAKAANHSYQDIPRDPEAARGFGCRGDHLVPRALERTVGSRSRSTSLPKNRFPQSQWTIHPHAHDSFRNFELSLQSPLHPSIALLVRYRSHTGIQPYQGYTWRFRLQSQGALLVHQAGVNTQATGRPTVAELQHGAVTLDSKSIPDSFTDAWPRDAVL